MSIRLSWCVHYSRPRSRAPFILLVLLLLAGASHAQVESDFRGNRTARAASSFAEQAEGRILALVNDFRAQEKRPPLAADERLADAAQYFAGFVARSGQFDHTADGSTPGQRAKQRGYDSCAILENIAYDFSSRGFTPEALARNFVDGWKQSPTHRENMLDPDVTQTGIAVARSARDGGYYAVQMFARPASQMVKFRIANRSSATIRYEFRNRTAALPPKQTRTHEACRAGELKIDWPGSQPDTVVRPKNGDRFTIVESGRGVFSLSED